MIRHPSSYISRTYLSIERDVWLSDLPPISQMHFQRDWRAGDTSGHRFVQIDLGENAKTHYLRGIVLRCHEIVQSFADRWRQTLLPGMGDHKNELRVSVI